MRRKSATEILFDCLDIPALISDLTDERESLRQLAIQTGIDYTKERVQSSGGGSRIEDTVIRLQSNDDKLSRQIDELVRTREQMKRLINKMESQRLKRLLTLRYLCGLDVKTVMERMGYAQQSSYFRAHKQAIKLLEDIDAGERRTKAPTVSQKV